MTTIPLGIFFLGMSLLAPVPVAPGMSPDELLLGEGTSLADTSLRSDPAVGREGRSWWSRHRGHASWADGTEPVRDPRLVHRVAGPWDHAAAPRTPTADPLLWGANGNVLDIARSGNTLYIAGAFRTVGENSGGLVPVHPRTGEALRPFPRVAGFIYEIVPDGSGGWYIGGEFTAVGGEPRSCLAQIRADGSVTDWNPNVTGSPGYIDAPSANAIVVVGERVYVGGAFREVGGLPRENLGCVDAKSGEVLDWNPGTHVDGYVYTLAASDTTVFVGGYFFYVGGQPRSCLAAVDAMTGEVLPWDPYAGGAVWCLLARGSTLYVGGEFGQIADGSRPHLAAINIPTAQLLPFDAGVLGVYLDRAPRPWVSALALIGDTLYAGGSFTEIRGEPRHSLVALDAETGAALPWTPASLGPYTPGYPPPSCYALVVWGGTVYVGGTFRFAGGESRPFAAAVTRDTGELTEWNPKFDYPVRALAASEDRVLVAGEFGFVGEWRHRAGLAAIDLTTGALKPWNPNPDGPACNAVAVRGDRVFVSGSFSNIGGDPQPRSRFAALDTTNGEVLDWNPGANSVATTLLARGDTLYAAGQFTQVGGVERNRLAAIHAMTGEVLPWNPGADQLVEAMTYAESTIYVGGIFQRVGGQWRSGLAAVDATSGAVLPWNPGTDNSTVYSLLVCGNTVYVGGSFAEIAGQPREGLAALDATTGIATSWNPAPTNWDIISPRIRALALRDSLLCVGGSFASIGGQPRICFAAVDTATGLATDWDPGVDGLVWSIASEGNTVYVGGGFTRAGGLPAAGLAAFSYADEPASAPRQLALAQNTPNPCASNATIRFSLPEAARVTLSVFDLQGRRIATLLDRDPRPAGHQQVPVRVERWKPGVYMYRLEVGGRSATRKMVVIE